MVSYIQEQMEYLSYWVFFGLNGILLKEQIGVTKLFIKEQIEVTKPFLIVWVDGMMGATLAHKDTTETYTS